MEWMLTCLNNDIFLGWWELKTIQMSCALVSFTLSVIFCHCTQPILPSVLTSSVNRMITYCYFEARWKLFTLLSEINDFEARFAVWNPTFCDWTERFSLERYVFTVILLFNFIEVWTQCDQPSVSIDRSDWDRNWGNVLMMILFQLKCSDIVWIC